MYDLLKRYPSFFNAGVIISVFGVILYRGANYWDKDRSAQSDPNQFLVNKSRRHKLFINSNFRYDN